MYIYIYMCTDTNYCKYRAIKFYFYRTVRTEAEMSEPCGLFEGLENRNWTKVGMLKKICLIRSRPLLNY